MAIRQTTPRLNDQCGSEGKNLAYTKSVITWKGIKEDQICARGHLVLVSRTRTASCQHSGSVTSVTMEATKNIPADILSKAIAKRKE